MFGYLCEECRQGTVCAQTIPNYKTTVRGKPFVVPAATIGVCDHCGVHYFHRTETRRWESLFDSRHSKPRARSGRVKAPSRASAK